MNMRLATFITTVCVGLPDRGPQKKGGCNPEFFAMATASPFAVAMDVFRGGAALALAPKKGACVSPGGLGIDPCLGLGNGWKQGGGWKV